MMVVETENRSDVCGGEEVFKGTRLVVRHVGKMFWDGASLKSLMDDFDLSRDQVWFAKAVYELENECPPG